MKGEGHGSVREREKSLSSNVAKISVKLRLTIVGFIYWRRVSITFQLHAIANAKN